MDLSRQALAKIPIKIQIFLNNNDSDGFLFIRYPQIDRNQSSYIRDVAVS